MFDPSSLRYRLLDFLHRFVEKSIRWTGVLLAFISGVWINALSDPDLSGPREFFLRIYDVRVRPLNWLPAIVTILLIALPIARSLTRRYLRGKDFATQLSQIYAANVSSTIEPFHHGRLAWGAELVLQSCPDLSIGWRPREITIHREPTDFRFQDSNLERTFKRWTKTKAAQPDLLGTGLRLTRNPAAFSDSPDLQLDVEPSPWACTMFFKDNVAVLAAERSRYIDRALHGPIEFPHNLALQAVIATSDEWVLITERSPKVRYFPDCWSCSIEEQLSLKDIQTSESEVMEQWIRRMLFEELGVDRSGIHMDNARVFAVFLETDILNCSLAGLITLKYDRETLNAIIDKHPRPDYEFQSWDFIRWSDLSRELVVPSRHYHPSTGLRMFLAGISKYGVIHFGRQLHQVGRR
jgi:hypothetical protein